MKFIKISIAVFFAVIMLTSCYYKSVMFKTDREYLGDSTAQKTNATDKNYVIHINDYIQYNVYTNKGERLIDPNFELRKGTMIPQGIDIQKYIVYNDSTAIFPMIGKQKVAGLRLFELDSLLRLKYGEFYNDVFVVSRILNKRVFVLGTAAAGTVGTGNAKVIPLENENMNLIEVITLAGGLDNLSKAHNIRLIRGDLRNPTVMVIDLSTIEGMKSANLLVQPNDIIYIERFQRKFAQTLQESTGIISIVSSVLFLTFSIITISRQ